jgi:hypothetical protein
MPALSESHERDNVIAGAVSWLLFMCQCSAASRHSEPVVAKEFAQATLVDVHHDALANFSTSSPQAVQFGRRSRAKSSM